jgi:hypothetical protein
MNSNSSQLSLWMEWIKNFLKRGLFVLSFVYLTACGVVTPVPTTTQTANFTPTPTSQLSWVVQRNNDCFIATGFNPGVAEKDDVTTLWGQPSSIDFAGTDYEWWHYHTSGRPFIWFDGNIVESATIFLERCTLGDTIVTLGYPEIVELTTLYFCTGNDVLYQVTFHYASRGFSFTHNCPSGSTEEECLSFYPDDDLTSKDFYENGKSISASDGRNMNSIVFAWTGFDH